MKYHTLAWDETGTLRIIANGATIDSALEILSAPPALIGTAVIVECSNGCGFPVYAKRCCLHGDLA